MLLAGAAPTRPPSDGCHDSVQAFSLLSPVFAGLTDAPLVRAAAKEKAQIKRAALRERCQRDMQHQAAIGNTDAVDIASGKRVVRLEPLLFINVALTKHRNSGQNG